MSYDEQNPSKVIQNFISAINKRDLEELASLMSGDHEFMDGLGQMMQGRDVMKEGWAQYFRLFPDYKVEVENMLEEGSVVAVFGWASATFSDRLWRIPAAWRGIVENGKVKKWQVYTDSEPVWKAMGVRRY